MPPIESQSFGNLLKNVFHGHQVRCVQHDDGTTWFVAIDICRAIGISNTTMAMRRIPEDDKQVIDLYAIKNAKAHGNSKDPVNIVSEAGMYQLILASTKPEAQDFKNWVTRVLLPVIRRSPGIPVGRRPVLGFELLRIIDALNTARMQLPEDMRAPVMRRIHRDVRLMAGEVGVKDRMLVRDHNDVTRIVQMIAFAAQEYPRLLQPKGAPFIPSRVGAPAVPVVKKAVTATPQKSHTPKNTLHGRNPLKNIETADLGGMIRIPHGFFSPSDIEASIGYWSSGRLAVTKQALGRIITKLNLKESADWKNDVMDTRVPVDTALEEATVWRYSARAVAAILEAAYADGKMHESTPQQPLPLG